MAQKEVAKKLGMSEYAKSVGTEQWISEIRERPVTTIIFGDKILKHYAFSLFKGYPR